MVGAFAAGGDGEGGCGQGLAWQRVVGDAGDKVDVEGAEDSDAGGGHFGGGGWFCLVRGMCFLAGDRSLRLVGSCEAVFSR